MERRQLALHEYIESQEEKHTFAFPPTNASGSRGKSLGPGTTDTIDSNDTNPNFLSPDSTNSKSGRNPTNLLVKFRDQNSMKKSPSSSPTSMVNGNGHTNDIGNTESIDRMNKANAKASGSKINNFFQRFTKETTPVPESQGKTSKRTVKLSGNSTNSSVATQQVQPQSVLKVPNSNGPSAGLAGGKGTNNTATRRSFLDTDADFNDQQGTDVDHDEIRAINEHVHEYYYAVRILPGQNPRSVYIGWVTSRFKPILQQEHVSDDSNSTGHNRLAKLIRRCTITQTSEDGSIIESVNRQDAYMFRANDLLESMNDAESVARRVVNGLLIGCLCDVSTGQLTFQVNGKESTHKLAVSEDFFYRFIGY